MAFDDSQISLKLKQMQAEAEEREAERLADSLDLPYLSVGKVSPHLDALKTVSEAEARSSKLCPVALQKKDLAVVIQNPKDPSTVQTLTKLQNAGYRLSLFIVSLSTLKKAWEHYKEIVEVQREITANVEISESQFEEVRKNIQNLEEVKRVCENFATQSTTDILNFVFAASIIIDASDIHFETAKESVRLRFRVDGVLTDVCNFPLPTYKQILNRLKLLAGLKINITSTPQDGRFTIKVGQDEIEVRVATSPSEYGEVVVMRVLNPRAIGLTLSDLGLRRDDEEIALQEIKRPNGMILVTGPTGSGKTTTLYAFLKNISNPELKIITIEDPIEYHLQGIEQTQTDSKAGYTFASGLRSILRQDPDIILVGEIRDQETGEIAVNASLTGHLVFSTLHTNNAVGAIPRLIDLGVKPNIIGPALSLVIAQRLVRKLCPHCRKEKEISGEFKLKIDKLKSELPPKVKPYSENDHIYEPVGCDKCHDGYKGRIGIYEFLKLTGEYEGLLNKDATEYSIKEFAVKKGLVQMQIDGILKTLAGITTLDEVEKVTGPIEW